MDCRAEAASETSTGSVKLVMELGDGGEGNNEEERISVAPMYVRSYQAALPLFHLRHVPAKWCYGGARSPIGYQAEYRGGDAFLLTSDQLVIAPLSEIALTLPAGSHQHHDAGQDSAVQSIIMMTFDRLEGEEVKLWRLEKSLRIQGPISLYSESWGAEISLYGNQNVNLLPHQHYKVLLAKCDTIQKYTSTGSEIFHLNRHPATINQIQKH